MKLDWLLKLDPATLRLVVNCGQHWDLRVALNGLPPNESEIIYWYRNLGRQNSLEQIRDFYEFKGDLTVRDVQSARLNLRRMKFHLNRLYLSWEIDDIQKSNLW